VRFKQYKNTHYWKERMNGHLAELRKESNPSLDESKAVLCPDPRCGLSFELVDDLQCHLQDIHCCDLLKFIPRGSATNRALLKEDPESESISTGSHGKTRINFVNETVETLSPLRIEHFAPVDETGEKRKRGRPRSQSRAVQYFESESGLESSDNESQSDCNSGSTGSLSSPASFRNCAVEDLESEDELETSDNDSETEAEYELVEPSATIHNSYWVSTKRRREGNLGAMKTTPQVVIYV
jgi:hypothetical protein